MDQEKIKKIINELIEKMTLDAEEVNFVCENNSDSLHCKIRSRDPYLFIGKNGEALDAINYLLRKIVEKDYFKDKKNENNVEFFSSKLPFNIFVDVNDFRSKKEESIKNLAHMMAERAKFFKSSVEVEPMSAYDRRIIHEFLADRPNIKTESTGEGNNRRVVIKYLVSSGEGLFN